MGAPRVGLLAASKAAWTQYSVESGSGHTVPSYINDLLSAKLWVVDIGINRVWRSYGEDYGLASGLGVSFGTEWFSALHVSQLGMEEDEEEDEDET